MRRPVLLVAGALLPGNAAGLHYYPRGVEGSKVLSHGRDVAPSYDYVVVGGGTAGLTVADRLSADGRTTVLVIEYGELSEQDHHSTCCRSIAGMLSFWADDMAFYQ